MLLMTLAALPHGVCFCDALQAATIAPVEAHDDEAPDDHDDDCACKLNADMAVLSADADAARAGHHDHWIVIAVQLSQSYSAVHSSTFSPRTRRAYESTAPIPCALRI